MDELNTRIHIVTHDDNTQFFSRGILFIEFRGFSSGRQDANYNFPSSFPSHLLFAGRNWAM